jgi:short chain dehydrogenase
LLIRPSHHRHARAGFFEQAPIEKILVNHECNATSGIQVAHHFIKLLVSQKKKGCVVFTSSIAASIPTPFAAMYASTKAFISQLAASLHIECQPLGIDVCAIHPSPVASNFYAKLDHKVDMIEAAAKGAVSPDSLMNDMFRSIGVCAWRDLGGAILVFLRAYCCLHHSFIALIISPSSRVGMAMGTRMGTFFLPFNFFAEMFAFAAPYLPDWKNHVQHR